MTTDDLWRRRTPAGPCPFCEIVHGRAPAEVVSRWPDAIAIRPLDPVVDGHLLVIPRGHVDDALEDAIVTAAVMARAAELGRLYGCDLNLITSVGRAATQTVRHLHVHLVPRAEGDGLALPWTGQGVPACSECGGRPKRGLIRSEDGESWQCAGCYQDLAAGPAPIGAAT